jgi:hypothetical protein
MNHLRLYNVSARGEVRIMCLATMGNRQVIVKLNTINCQAKARAWL